MHTKVKGSVYFDVAKYNKDHHYGKLSGRNLDDVLNTTRELDGQDEKHNPADFALWKCAQPEHIMRWPSPWSNGFPGWHCECTAMGRKYLGEHFRHSWRRHGPYVPASRMRNCTSCGFRRSRYRLLDAQQHDYRERTENG